MTTFALQLDQLNKQKKELEDRIKKEEEEETKKKRNIQSLINQLKQENHEKKEFIKNNVRRLKYKPVQCSYNSINTTQSRFELLLTIIEKQQEQLQRQEERIEFLWSKNNI